MAVRHDLIRIADTRTDVVARQRFARGDEEILDVNAPAPGMRPWRGSHGYPRCAGVLLRRADVEKRQRRIAQTADKLLARGHCVEAGLERRLHRAVLDEPDVIRKKFKTAVTDSGREVRYEPDEKPGVSNLIEILSVSTGARSPRSRPAYDGRGYGDLKGDVGEAVVELFAPVQARYAELRADEGELRRLLGVGADKARETRRRRSSGCTSAWASSGLMFGSAVGSGASQSLDPGGGFGARLRRAPLRHGIVGIPSPLCRRADLASASSVNREGEKTMMKFARQSTGPRRPRRRLCRGGALGRRVSHRSATASAAGPCQLGNKDGQIKHVIYLQFDNTHFRRDRANVPSDLEQMPHLLNFLKGNGTLLTNDHTILISHTAGGILASLTGLYPDRNGPDGLEQLRLLPRERHAGVHVVVQVLDGHRRRHERLAAEHGRRRRADDTRAVAHVHARRLQRRRRLARRTSCSRTRRPRRRAT